VNGRPPLDPDCLRGDTAAGRPVNTLLFLKAPRRRSPPSVHACTSSGRFFIDENAAMEFPG
jgi:hypothetical protein